MFFTSDAVQVFKLIDTKLFLESLHGVYEFLLQFLAPDQFFLPSFLLSPPNTILSSRHYQRLVYFHIIFRKLFSGSVDTIVFC